MSVRTQNLWRSIALWILVGVAYAPNSVRAQAWIGELAARRYNEQSQAQRASDCITGKMLAEKDVAPARDAAKLTMANYWRAVEGGKAVEIAPYFLTGGAPIWDDMGTKVAIVDDSKVIDRFAKSGAELTAEPFAFFRAGDGLSARGRWPVRDRKQALLGIYDADFKPGKNGWLLTRLALINIGEFIEPVVQYCHHQGDVLQARVSKLQSEIELAVAKTQKLSAQTEAALQTSFLRRTQAYDTPQDGNKRLIAEQAEAEADRLGRLLEAAAQSSISTIKSLQQLEAEEAAAYSLRADIWADLSK